MGLTWARGHGQASQRLRLRGTSIPVQNDGRAAAATGPGVSLAHAGCAFESPRAGQGRHFREIIAQGTAGVLGTGLRGSMMPKAGIDPARFDLAPAELGGFR